MNLKGILKLFKGFVTMINNSNLFDKINVQLNESDLKIEHVDPLNWPAYGDLLWDKNINKNKLQNLDINKEVVYNSPMESVYINKYGNIKNYYKSFSIINKSSFQEIMIDKTSIIEWSIISKNILRNVNNYNYDNNYKVLIYYDSFTCSLIPVLFKTFKECIMIKEPFKYDENNNIIINKFKPDFILDFSVFRFITK